MGANNDFATYQLYAYCGNCPIDRYDAGGYFWKKVVNKAKKAVKSAINNAKTIINNKIEEIKPAVRTALNKTNKCLVYIGIDTAAVGAFFLNMTKVNGIYHANFDCWQRICGYNDFYDFMFDIGTSMLNRKFDFKYSNTWYILWAWKGNYINLGAGAELGIYYCKYFRGPHWFVDKKLAMDMSMVLKYRGSTIINHSAKTWWITGFNPNPKYYDVKASDLKVSFTVRFSNTKLYEAFMGKYKNKGTWTFPKWMEAKFTF